MRERKHSGRGSRRRSSGDGERDLFDAAQLNKAVKDAFAAVAATTAAAAGSSDAPSLGATATIAAAAPATPPPTTTGTDTDCNVSAEEIEQPREHPSTAADTLAMPAEQVSFEAPTARSGRSSSPSPRSDKLAAPEIEGPEPDLDVDLDSPQIAPAAESLPARMMNEFVYCPRLFHYEHVQGVFVESVDTVKGSALHKRVDKGKGALREAQTVDSAEDEKKRSTRQKSPEATPSSPAITEGDIHSCSVMLGSERLGVVAKMDLVEVTLAEDGSAASVCPVDYKIGAPKSGSEDLELWDTDRMQLGLQCLVLRDNGYRCHQGLIYYRQTKQKVPLEVTPELEAWILQKIAAARACAAGPIPPPLIDSPKCARCSLAPVCLPDETRMLSVPTTEKFDPDGDALDDNVVSSPSSPPRRLMAARSEKRALYLNTQGYRVGCNDGVIKVKEKDRTVDEVRAMDVEHVAVFGNIQVSTQAVQRLCDADIPVTWFSMGGWFYGLTRGHSLKNVLVRIEQFRHAADPASCLRLARQFVRGKIHNHRVMFMRNHIAPPERTKLRLGQAREDALATSSLDELLGVEGAAAAEYFQQFGGMLRETADDDHLEGLEDCELPDRPATPRFTFDFKTRNRRPPTDPVNALLSLAYSLLAKECTLAALAVGLDPYVGFYHQPRHGRPALALDLMEEFRPLIAESAVLTAINNRFVSPLHFVSAGRAVNLNPAGRRQFFQCFEQRMSGLVTHPLFDYRVSYRRAVELQFRILARALTGEIPEYVPFLTR